MQPFFESLQSYPPISKNNTGTNGHYQEDWSDKIDEIICQYYFQCVRSFDSTNQYLNQTLNQILTYLYSDKIKYYEHITLMKKMVLNTRDIICGKGEYNLTYMMIMEWYNFDSEWAKYAIELLVTPIEEGVHPYGSWKDIKYLSQYVKDNTSNDNKHPLIIHSIKLLINQLDKDYQAFLSKSGQVSLAGKWCPREKSKFDWLFKDIVYHKSKDYMTCDKNKQVNFRKVCKHFRQMLSTLNKHIDTVQIKMCDKRWSEIKFNNVTSNSMTKLKKAFMNINYFEMENPERNANDEDRIQCAKNLNIHIESAANNNDNCKINGKRTSLYQLVKDAYELPLDQYNSDTFKIINTQWADHLQKDNSDKFIIPIADVSGSMTSNNCIPLFNSIGMSIKLSEMNHPAFKDRVLTFSSKPKWIDLSKCETFVDKVKVVLNAPWGMNTDFYAAMDMVLEIIIKENLNPDFVKNIIIAVFSDMQFDDASIKQTPYSNIYDSISKKYAELGIKSEYEAPYQTPHIVFWNLTQTMGFPCDTTQKGVSMLSGYSPVLLEEFSKKGIESINNLTPITFLKEILNNDRYKANWILPVR